MSLSLRAGDDDPMTRPRPYVPPSVYHGLQRSQAKTRRALNRLKLGTAYHHLA